MKILAIRGQNLASLAKPFELALTVEPLAGAGLFAITGETGSGKSTILDALCLALYNQYPRVAIAGRRGESAPDPGGDALAISDPRSILRRGAASGFAEVDFLAQDGVQYRARWTVNRARGKADGRLGKVDRSLALLADGTPVAEGITNVAREIQRCTELTFDQFRRTVLLAQGEFDTFLLAEESDRADLLEKVTGTQIYGDISKKIHEETTRLRRAMTELVTRRDAIGLLSPEERATQESEQANCCERIAEHGVLRSTLLSDLEVRRLIGNTRTALLHAERSCADTAERLQNAQPEIDRLRVLDAAEPLRSAQVLMLNAEAALPAAQREEASAKEALPPKNEAAVQAHAQRGEALKQLQAADAAIKEFEPVWARAGQLDALIEQAHNHWSNGQHEAAQATGRREVQQVAVDTLHRNRQRKDDEFAAISQALAQSAADDELAGQWDRTQTLIEQHGEQTRIAAASASTLQQAQQALEQLNTAEGEAEAGVASSERLRNLRIDEANELRAALAAADEPALERKQEALALLLPLADEGHRLSLEHDRAYQERARATAGHATAMAAGDAASVLARDAEGRREAQQALRARLLPLDELAQQSISEHAERLRSFLIAGEACPVCGSPEHPVQDNAALNRLANDLRQQREASDTAIGLCDQQSRQAASDLATAEAQIEAHEAALEATTQAIESATERYASLRPQLEGGLPASEQPVELPRILDTSSASLLQVALEQVKTTQEAVRSGMAETRSLRQKLARVDLAVGQARDAVDDARRRSNELTQQRVPAETNLERATGNHTRADEDVARTEQQLAGVLAIAGIEVALLRSLPQQVLLTLSGRVDAYTRLCTAAATLAGDLRELGAQLATGDVELKHLTKQDDLLRADVGHRLEDLCTLQTERKSLLGGERTADHRTRHTDARFVAANDLQKADHLCHQADSARSVAASAVQSTTAARERAAQEAVAAALRFEQRCDQLGQTAEAVNAALAVSAENKRALRDRIAQNENACVAAESARTARADDLAAAMAGVDESRTVDTLGAELGHVDSLLNQENQALGTINNLLERDREAQLHAQELAADIDAKQAVLDGWDAVDDAVGSSDGTRFRQFAQGTTLAHLTALANTHLSSLGPRYSLLQGGASELAVYVQDRDMDDQIRSSRSLSGGERFLISLSLALALSGLEGGSSFVDTLFIDEGFGSLDRDTLDIAVDALERLQSSGRKVGVITHVAAMIDRIAVQVKVQKLGGGLSQIAE